MREVDEQGNIVEDIQFHSTFGMSRNDFLRKAQLMRSPEGMSDNKYCPNCKKPVRTNEKGDMYCTNYSLDYEKNGKCFWHRYADGLNYWSSPVEIAKVKAQEYPELRGVVESMGIKL